MPKTQKKRLNISVHRFGVEDVMTGEMVDPNSQHWRDVLAEAIDVAEELHWAWDLREYVKDQDCYLGWYCDHTCSRVGLVAEDGVIAFAPSAFYKIRWTL